MNDGSSQPSINGGGGTQRLSSTGAAGLATNPQSQQSQQQPNGQRIEAIKQYYNQLCTNLRNIVGQLNAPEVTPQRRLTLLSQQEQVQKSLQEFTEKVLKPLASAAASATPSGAVTNGTTSGGAGITQAMTPATISRVSSMSMSGLGPMTNTVMGHKTTSSPLTSATSTAPLVQPPTLPPLLFQHAPLAARQTLMAVQKQAQMIQQQQVLFNQRIQSKNFDSSLNHAHLAQLRPCYDDTGLGLGSFALVSSEASNSSDKNQSSNAQAVALGKTITDLFSEVSSKLPCPSTELEEAFLRVADDFIDKVGTFAAQLALNRKDARICRKDVELALERQAGIVLPGSNRSTLLAASVKKLTKKQTSVSSNNPHHNRMAQLKKFMTSQNHLN